MTDLPGCVYNKTMTTKKQAPAPLGDVIPRERSLLTLPRLHAIIGVNPHYGPLGYTLAALKAGAVVGDTFIVKHPGWRDVDTYVIVAQGGGDRTPNGEWSDQVA